MHGLKSVDIEKLPICNVRQQPVNGFENEHWVFFMKKKKKKNLVSCRKFCQIGPEGQKFLAKFGFLEITLSQQNNSISETLPKSAAML